MAEKDSKLTERDVKSAQNMTESSPGARDMGGKPAGQPTRQNRAEDGPAAVGGRAGDGPVPNAQQGAQGAQGGALRSQPVDSPTAPKSAVAPFPTGDAAEAGQTVVNTQPPHPGFTTGIGADPMQQPVGQTGPLRTGGRDGEPKRGPVWLRNEAGEDYLAPGEGPRKGDTMELVGPGGERWSVEVDKVHGKEGEPDYRADVLIKGVAMPGAASAGARIEFPS